MSNKAEQEAGGEQQQPGSDAEHRPTVIGTDANAMRRFCTDLWNDEEAEALQVVRTEAAVRMVGSVNACQPNRD